MTKPGNGTIQDNSPNKKEMEKMVKEKRNGKQKREKRREVKKK
jgi:hypothetical protein